MSPRTRNRLVVGMLLAALAMRAGIPDGYMPAAPGSGLLFELCPAGVPAAVMHKLGGGHHHGSHDDSISHFDASQCPVGHMLSSAVAFGDLWQFDATPADAVVCVAAVPALLSRSPRVYRSRDPPA